MDYLPMGSPAWKRRERKDILESIEFYQNHIKDMEAIHEAKGELEPKTEQLWQDVLQGDRDILAMYQRDLKLLREGDEYAKRYKKDVL